MHSSDLNIYFFVIATWAVDLSISISGDTDELLDLDHKSAKYVILNIRVYVQYKRGHSFNLIVISLAPLFYEPGQNLGPIELQLFQFGFSIYIAVDELFLDASDVAIHNHELALKIHVEVPFLEYD